MTWKPELDKFAGVEPGEVGNFVQSDGMNWKSSSDLPLPKRRHWAQARNGQSSAVDLVGISTVNAQGAGQAAAPDTTGPWVEYTTVASNGSSGGWGHGWATTRRDWKPLLLINMKPGSNLTVCRFLLGFSSSTFGADTGGGVETAMFRCSSVAGDTTWKTITSNTGATTVTDTGVTVTSGVSYELRIDMSDSSNIKFYINGDLVSTHTTNLPSGSTDLSGQALVTNTTTAQRILYLRNAVVVCN